MNTSSGLGALRTLDYTMLLCEDITAMRSFFKVPPPDVDAAAAQLVDRGVDLLEPVHDLEDFGHRVVFFADPEGNVIEIFAET